MEGALTLARWAQLAAAMVVFGAPLFYLTGPREGLAPGARPLLIVAAVIGAFSAGFWLYGRALDLGGPSVLIDVALSTQFGRATTVRLTAFLLVLGLTFGRARWAYVAIAGAIAAASLAWTGHGLSDDGLAGAIHLAADVVHVLAAAAWLGALVPLLILVRQVRNGATAETARAGLARFSGVGPTLVSLLIASGLVNGWFLVGAENVAALTTSTYGRWLLIKLAVFAIMLGLAGLNRWVLAPSLAARGLVVSLIVEIVAGGAVLPAVAVLGSQIPPASL